MIAGNSGVRIAPASRAAATSGPKVIHAAAAAGNERADGPVPQPHPKYAAARPLQRHGARKTIAPASTNGALSSSIAAAFTTIALTTRINHVLAVRSQGAGPA